MKQYLDYLERILLTGELRDQERTGTGTLSVFGERLEFNLKDGFPSVTTKELNFPSVVSELLWFLAGSTNERDLAKIRWGDAYADDKKTIWTANLKDWNEKHGYRESNPDCGNIYGHQWRNFNGVEGLFDGFDQITNLIKELKTNKQSRRHYVSAWNPEDVFKDYGCLPPCHLSFQMYVDNNDNLSCMMNQRSGDSLLGIPYNIASYALLTHMIAQVCDLGVGKLIMNIGDSHIYNDHIEQVKEQLTREPLPLPTLYLNPDIDNIFDFKMSDIELIGYDSHPPIKAKMAV